MQNVQSELEHRWKVAVERLLCVTDMDKEVSRLMLYGESALDMCLWIICGLMLHVSCFISCGVCSPFIYSVSVTAVLAKHGYVCGSIK